jgi:hypothetical protein
LRAARGNRRRAARGAALRRGCWPPSAECRVPSADRIYPLLSTWLACSFRDCGSATVLGTRRRPTITETARMKRSKSGHFEDAGGRFPCMTHNHELRVASLARSRVRYGSVSVTAGNNGPEQFYQRLGTVEFPRTSNFPV